jgi:hypothetical protein
MNSSTIKNVSFAVVILCAISAIIVLARAFPTPQVMPDRLVVTRTKNNPNDSNASPFTKTITGPAVVQKLYADIEALPPAPNLGNEPINCPLDLGVQYHLDFYSGDTIVLSADYAPTGCGGVALGNGELKLGTNSFETELWQALGFPSVWQFVEFR